MNKFVIFDLDGTIFDSMPFWDGVGREYLRGLGVTSFPEDFNERVKTMSVAQSSMYFKEIFDIDVTVDDISEGMKKIVGDRYRYLAIFKPNVKATLDTLFAKGVKMCIATATYRTLVEEALDRLEARYYFDFVLSCNDIGIGKDRPEIFIEAMRRLGGNIDETVVVEDSLHAITTAKNANFKVLAVEDSYQSKNIDAIKKLADKYQQYMDADTILNL